MAMNMPLLRPKEQTISCAFHRLAHWGTPSIYKEFIMNEIADHVELPKATTSSNHGVALGAQ